MDHSLPMGWWNQPQALVKSTRNVSEIDPRCWWNRPRTLEKSTPNVVEIDEHSFSSSAASSSSHVSGGWKSFEEEEASSLQFTIRTAHTPTHWLQTFHTCTSRSMTTVLQTIRNLFSNAWWSRLMWSRLMLSVAKCNYTSKPHFGKH